MKKLKRFNPKLLINIEFRVSIDGIGVYELNKRTWKYDKYLGLIYLRIEDRSHFCFQTHSRWQLLYSDTFDEFNKKLQKRWGQHAYLTQEAFDYLESIVIMKKLRN